MLSTASAHSTPDKGSGRSPAWARGAIALAMLLACAVEPVAASPLEDYFAAPRIPSPEIVVAGRDEPGWLAVWREARRLAGAGDHGAARAAYSRLLDMKGDSVEARWECAALLLSLKEFDLAIGLLETLVEQFPERVDYLNGLGYAMQKKGHYGRAVELFDRASGREPANIVALTGLSEGLLALGNLGLALPRLEALNERRVDDVDLQKRLVRLYMDLHLAAKARPLALRLAERPDATPADWKLAARAHGEPGQEEIAARCWQKVVKALPEEKEGHAWLADYFADGGRWRDALAHLLVLLAADEGNADLLVRVADVYLRLREPEQAIPYYERYLVQHPDDKDVLRRLVGLYGDLGREADTLAALDRYFTVEPDPSSGNLRQAATLYDEAGRPGEAIPFYRRLLERDPDDADSLAALARNLLAIGENDGALATLSRLARIAPDSTAVYRSMMDLLIRLDRREELVGVLAELNRLDPADIEVALRFSSALLARQDAAGAERVFLPLAGQRLDDPLLLRLRAEIFEGLAMPDHALDDYLAIVEAGDETPELRIKCLELAAAMGRTALASALFERIAAENPPAAHLLRVADGFRDGGGYETAHGLYRQLLDQASESPLRQRILFSFARSYALQNLVFEAEQVLRIALLEDPGDGEILARLVDLHLEAGYGAEAALWLEQLDAVVSAGGGAGDDGSVARRQWLARLLHARLLNGFGKFSAARKKLRVLLGELTEGQGGEAIFYQERSLTSLVRLELARSCLALEEYDEAEDHCRQLMDRHADVLAGRVLLQKIYAARGEDGRAKALHATEMAEAGRDLGRMLQLADAYRREGLKKAMAESAAYAAAMSPDSFTAQFRRAHAVALAGDLRQTLAEVETLGHDFPESTAVRVLGARTSFALGLDAVALAYCDAILANQPYRADMQLLKARIFWRQPDWGESLPVYENYLIPAVHDLLVEQAREAGLFVPAEEEASLWQQLNLAPPAKDRFVERIMTPAFIMESGNVALKKIAAPLYSRYKWQQRFAGEHAARRFVEQRDDFQAAALFRQLSDRYPEDESLLFDLAGIHSRLDQLGEEALLYDRLAAMDPDYPGLQKAMERNRLKRQPRLTITYRHENEDGWDGYQSIRKNALDVGAWASTQPGSEADMTLSTISYGSADADDTLDSRRAFVSYDKNLLDRFDVSLGGGVENLEGAYSDTGLIECGVKGRVSDRVRGEVRYERDVVDDTVASLSRNIVAENIRAGLFLGILPRLLTGGDYDYTAYSDGNDIKGYSFWASYILLPEPTSLQLRFHYSFKDAEEGGNDLGPLFDDGFAENDHPYWTPRNYWKNGYAVLWTHKLSTDTLERGTPSYYSGEYLVEYDANGHMLQTARGIFSLELSKDWMLESSVRLVLSDEYRAKDLTLSAIYRW